MFDSWGRHAFLHFFTLPLILLVSVWDARFFSQFSWTGLGGHMGNGYSFAEAHLSK